MPPEHCVFPGTPTAAPEPLVLDGRIEPQTALLTLQNLPPLCPTVFIAPEGSPEVKRQAYELGAFAVTTDIEDIPSLFQSAAKLCNALQKQQKTEHLLRQTRKQVNADPLTGALNRRELDNCLQNEWRKQTQALSLLMIDIDHFKSVNDTYGHLQGDYCLKEVAKTLKTNLYRRSDRLFRYGGEEFAIILPRTEEYGARLVTHRLLNAVQTHKMAQAPWGVTVSIGVATFRPQQGVDPYYLLKCSDEALYTAKQNGRNRFAVALI